MKSSVATALSITGILAAGGVALAANTNLLDGGASTVKGSPAIAASVALTEDGTATGSNDLGGGGSTTATTPSGSKLSAAAAEDPTGDPNLEVTTYDIPNVATVTVTHVLDVNTISVTDVTPQTGWNHSIEAIVDGSQYVVNFENGSSAYEFHIHLIDLRVVTSLQNVTEQPVMPPPPHHDDDDDQGEDHDDDSYEHHDDEDHGSYGDHDEDHENEDW